MREACHITTLLPVTRTLALFGFDSPLKWSPILNAGVFLGHESGRAIDMLIISGDKVSETQGNTCWLLIKDGQRVDSEQIWSVSVSLGVVFIVFFHKLYHFSPLLREVKLPIPPTLVGLINNCWKWNYKGFSSLSRFYQSLCLYIHHVILSSGFQLSQIQR